MAKARTIVILIFQKRKFWHREVNNLPKHTQLGMKWEDQDSNSRSRSKAWPLTTLSQGRSHLPSHVVLQGRLLTSVSESPEGRFKE